MVNPRHREITLASPGEYTPYLIRSRSVIVGEEGSNTEEYLKYNGGHDNERKKRDANEITLDRHNLL